jgi:hypothetical protein
MRMLPLSTIACSISALPLSCRTEGNLHHDIRYASCRLHLWACCPSMLQQSIRESAPWLTTFNSPV